MVEKVAHLFLFRLCTGTRRLVSYACEKCPAEKSAPGRFGNEDIRAGSRGGRGIKEREGGGRQRQRHAKAKAKGYFLLKEERRLRRQRQRHRQRHIPSLRREMIAKARAKAKVKAKAKANAYFLLKDISLWQRQRQSIFHP